VDPDSYLARLGVDPRTVDSTDRATLERLQRAHVRTVPFETVAITGDPAGEIEGGGVSLDPEAIYEKVIGRERGGFCYELNGLFGRLLAEFGFDVDRVAARVLEDGELTPPASHMTHVVSLDRRYVVDVGMGIPTMRRPTPLDGSIREGPVGVAWRAVESDRPDADFLVQFRETGDGWTDRYVFDARPRETAYFRATCDHLTTAPESGFTGDPVASMATGEGHKKLDADSLARFTPEGVVEKEVSASEWTDVLEREFGISLRSESAE
jgi:N-hydroxyarylamine O-acetyltransferase